MSSQEIIIKVYLQKYCMRILNFYKNILKKEGMISLIARAIILTGCFLTLPLFSFSQSCAKYAVTLTPAITYTSIAGSGGTSNFIWRNITSNQNDDNRSYQVPIGFDFWYLGVRYINISAQLNGTVDFSSSASDGNTPVGSSA